MANLEEVTARIIDAIEDYEGERGPLCDVLTLITTIATHIPYIITLPTDEETQL